MKHYIQYHNSEVQGGRPVHKEGLFEVFTKKSVATLPGSCVWLISGEGKSPKKYFLEYVFLVDQIKKGETNVALGNDGIRLETPVFMNEVSWFADFKKSQQNFSLGMREIDAQFVDGFVKLAPEFINNQDPSKRIALHSVNEYARALLEVKEQATPAQWNMLLGHAAAQDSALSMTEIAKLRGYQTYGTANLEYGKLAGLLAEKMAVNELSQKMHVIGTAHANLNDDGHWQWEMHPHLVQALWQIAESEMLTHTEQVVDVQREFEVDPRLQNVDLTERSALVQARIGQGAYRQSLIQYWKGQCAVTGCPVSEVLIASHIKPWRESENNERLDPFNGLLLTATLDKLFDRGLISFSDDGDLIYDQSIEVNLEQLGIKPDACMRNIDQRHKPYLQNHRQRYGFE